MSFWSQFIGHLFHRQLALNMSSTFQTYKDITEFVLRTITPNHVLSWKCFKVISRNMQPGESIAACVSILRWQLTHNFGNSLGLYGEMKFSMSLYILAPVELMRVALFFSVWVAYVPHKTSNHLELAYKIWNFEGTMAIIDITKHIS